MPQDRQTTTTSSQFVDRIPVTVLTGFLGAGKTTLLNNLMGQPDMANAAVLINEFGEIGIDHHLVSSVDENVMLLDSGCVCCSMQGDLVTTLQDLSNRSSRREIPPITRVLIETTGLADPVPVISTLMEHGFVSARYACDGIITVVDATHAMEQLARHREALRQVTMADRLIITKSDLTDRARLATLQARLAELNPGASQRVVQRGQISTNALFGVGIYTAGKRPDVSAWMGEQAPRYRAATTPAFPPGRGKKRPSSLDAGIHDQNVRSFVVNFPDPVPWYGFSAIMGRILQEYGPRLLRIKGLVATPDNTTQPMVVHCVQDVAYPAMRLDAWPSGPAFAERCGRMVFIVQHLSETEETQIRTALSSLPTDPAAARAVAASPWLPTKCWLSQTVAAPNLSSYQVDGWVVQTVRPRRL